MNCCATCLLAVQYLGYAVFSLHGKLVLLTSTSISLWYKLVRGFVEVTREKLEAKQSGISRIPTIGTKKDKSGGTNAAILRLLAIMRDMKLTQKDVEKGSVNLWEFNNGKSTDCDIERIPNDCLRFLQKCAEDIGLDEISQIVKRDKSKREYALLNSIIQRRDYLPLYYSKKYGRPGASAKLYGMYQTLVLGCPPYLLCIARKIAEYIKETSDNDKLGIDLDILYDKQLLVKKFIVKMVEDGRLTFDEYYNMFILSKGYRPWKLVKYYLLTNDTNERIPEQFVNISNKDEYKEKVSRIANFIFDSYIKRRGPIRFKKEVLEGFKRGHIDRYWLRQQFERLASEDETLDKDENWKSLGLETEINVNFYNLRYLLRLLFISLVSQHL